LSDQIVILVGGLQLIVSLLFLLYASWSDLKTREVENKVWAFFAAVGLPLSLTYLFLNFSMGTLYYYLVVYGTMSGLSLLFFFVGLYGGADAKALICLSLALPLNPMNLIFRTAGPDIVFPLGVFTNGVILAALSFFYPLFRNMRWRLKNDRGFFEGFEGESKVRKFAVLISGYKIPIQSFEKNSFSLPLEDISISETGKTERKLVVLPEIEETEKAAQRIRDAGTQGGKIDWVWVTPGLPMLVFITSGLITALFLGNFVLIVMTHLIG